LPNVTSQMAIQLRIAQHSDSNSKVRMLTAVGGFGNLAATQPA
jgi:hypothetical protein